MGIFRVVVFVLLPLQRLNEGTEDFALSECLWSKHN
jgi:hypothetical protein